MQGNLILFLPSLYSSVMVEVVGIGPTITALSEQRIAIMLHLNLVGEEGVEPSSCANQTPYAVYKTVALPLCYSPMVEVTGVEPAYHWV